MSSLPILSLISAISGGKLPYNYIADCKTCLLLNVCKFDTHWHQIFDFKLIFSWWWNGGPFFFSWCGDSVLIFSWGHFVRNRKCRSVSQQFDIFYVEYLFIIIHFVAIITVIYYLDMCEFITSVIILQPNMINHFWINPSI